MARKRLYKLLPEHRARFPEWLDRWSANAMSTKAMDDEERRIVRDAVKGLYRAAELEPPPDERIVFVPSPFVGVFAAGFAAWMWWLREHPEQATVQWWGLGGCDVVDMIRLSTHLMRESAVKALGCAAKAWRMQNGGNQWSGWCSYLSFGRYVAQLDLDYSNWDHYEQAAIHSGPRWMHSKFCIVSDRPAQLTVDGSNKPHSETGPFCLWRDGSRLYSIHGVRVPGIVVEQPHLITAEMIEAEPSDDARSVMLARCPPAEAALFTIRKMKAAG
jgi:hypothetical protein